MLFKIYNDVLICLIFNTSPLTNSVSVVKKRCHQEIKVCDETGGTCKTLDEGKTIECKCPAETENKGDNGCQSNQYTFIL